MLGGIRTHDLLTAGHTGAPKLLRWKLEFDILARPGENDDNGHERNDTRVIFLNCSNLKVSFRTGSRKMCHKRSSFPVFRIFLMKIVFPIFKLRIFCVKIFFPVFVTHLGSGIRRKKNCDALGLMASCQSIVSWIFAGSYPGERVTRFSLIELFAFLHVCQCQRCTRGHSVVNS